MQIHVVKAGLTGVAPHKATHEPGGEDALTNLTEAAFAAEHKDGLPNVLSLRTLGTGAQQALPGNHVSVSNARVPTAHATSHEPGGTDVIDALTDENFAAANVDGADAEPSLRTLGTGAQQAAKGNHLHDTRYPRTINNEGPDETGNIVVDLQSAAGVGAVEGVAPNAPGGNINFTSTGGTVEFTADNPGDALNFDIPAHTAAAALAVDPTDGDTTRNKHLSNADAGKLHEVYLPVHGYYGPLAVVVGKGKIPIFRAGTLASIRTAVNTAPTGANLVVVIKKNGTTAATLTHTAGQTHVQHTVSVALAAGDVLTADITQIGSTVAGDTLTIAYLMKLS